MKKIKLIALLMAALTVTAAFTGCGKTDTPENIPEAGQSTSADDTQATTPEGAEMTAPETTPADDTQATAPETTPEEIPEATPEETVFPLAGTWRQIQKNSEEPSEYYIIDEEGNLTSNTGKEWTLGSVQEMLIEGDEALEVTFNGTDWITGGKRLYFYRYGNSYFIREGALLNNAPRDYYYREEDYTDYDVVKLTAENIADYIEYGGYYTTDKNDDGTITKVTYHEVAQFKTGLGLPSFVFGKIVYTSYCKNVTVDPATGEVTVGEAAEIEPRTNRDIVQFCGAGRYGEIDWSLDSVKIEGTDPAAGTLYYSEVTGAEGLLGGEIIGKVYVPKGWNP